MLLHDGEPPEQESVEINEEPVNLLSPRNRQMPMSSFELQGTLTINKESKNKKKERKKEAAVRNNVHRKKMSQSSMLDLKYFF